MSGPCWLCGHVHPEPGSYGCLETRVPYKDSGTVACYCPLKPSWAADSTKRHRATIRPTRRPMFGGSSYWPVCTCGWEGLSYYKRKPATEARDEHLADMEQSRAATTRRQGGTGDG
jgi:hypothetical protein